MSEKEYLIRPLGNMNLNKKEILILFAKQNLKMELQSRNIHSKRMIHF